MKKEEIIEIIITALQEKEILSAFHKMQNNQAVQIKLTDETYFNINLSELKKNERYIEPKL